MINRVVVREVVAEFAVDIRFIGHDVQLAVDVRFDDRDNLLLGRAIDVERTGRTAALDKGQDRVLVARAGARLCNALFAADVGLVNLNDAACAAHGRKAAVPHRLADAMAHEPSGFQVNAEGPVKLVSRDAFLRRAHKVNRLKPKMHRRMAVLEDSSNLNCELLPAGVTLMNANTGRIAAHPRNARGFTAMRANRTVRPKARFNPCIGGGFIVKRLGVENGLRHGC